MGGEKALTVGSANLNEHSFFNDTEMNVVTCDPTIAREMRLRLSRLDLNLMGLVELLIIVLVLAAIFGGVAVNPLLFVLLIVVILILFTRGGFGYRRGGRL